MLKKIIVYVIIFVAASCVFAQNNKVLTQEGDYLVDSAFQASNIIEVKYDSNAFKQLLKNNPEIKQYIEQNHNLKINLNGQNIVITENANVYQGKTIASLGNNIYAWLVISILLIFLVVVVALVFISKFHKKQNEE
jgi:predicted PurR-regulated permease PerM